MNGGSLLLLAVIALAAGYLVYSRRVAAWLGLGELKQTPAHAMNDGVDYVPARAPVLLGHHFASIAGAAPIIGPVLAVRYGWLPVFLWIVLGGIFLGAVHDFVTLVASVRNEGRSVGMIIEKHLGRTGKLLFLIFAWATLVLVIAVFTMVVSKQFVSNPSVATASILFIALALLFGVAINQLKVPLWIATVVGVAALFGCLWLGVAAPFPELLSPAAEGSAHPMATLWILVLMVYVFIASVAPVNVLLQPRDYLNSYLLYVMMAFAVVAIFFVRPEMEGPMVTDFNVEGLGPLFPLLFVTVACGAISGFHSMVASGTTAKQLNKETDARPVAYGGMLIESLLAVVALISAAYLSSSDYATLLTHGGGKADPIGVFSAGVANFMGEIGVPVAFGKTFIALTVSAFALTTLDTATRLGRFTIQELAMRRNREKQNILATNRYVATALTVGASLALLFGGKTLSTLWQLFGAANQLLAALALMAATLWLSRSGRKTLFTLIPMTLMYLVTLSALGWKFHSFLTSTDRNWVLGIMILVLFSLAIALGISFIRRFRTRQEA